MKKSRWLITFASLLLIATSLISIFCLPASAATEDYANPGATSKTTLDSADILEHALGFALSDAEREYLSDYGIESISYGALVPTKNITSYYDAEAQTLLVIARVYEYTATNGVKMTWVPTDAAVGDNREELVLGEDGRYSALLEGISEDGEKSVSVSYSSTISVSRRVINSLINKAYTDAPLWAAYGDYIDAIKQYYVDSALRSQYEADLKIFNEKYQKFLEETEALNSYNEQVDAYNNYVLQLEAYNSYQNYINIDKPKFDAEMAEYNNYVESCQLIADQLNIIAGIQRPGTPLERSVYGGIITETVTQVLASVKELIDELDVDPSIIKLAEKSTINLRSLFKDYFALTDENAKYTYYMINYESFKLNFTNLFVALEELYQNSRVRAAISSQGKDKTEKYEILVAQLYYTVKALTDGPVVIYDGIEVTDTNYAIGINKHTFLEIHYGTVYMEDVSTAVPLETFPEEKTAPDPIKEVAPVAYPQYVEAPADNPPTVSDPGQAPDFVETPTYPRTVEPPFSIGDPEKLDGLPEVIENIVTAYQNEELHLRDEVVDKASIALEIYASKKFLDVDEILITFYGTNGEKLDTVNAERESYVEIEADVPVKSEDDSATYVFVGWQDENGVEVDVTSVNCDGDILELYPKFEPRYKLYDVVWIIDGSRVVSEERYGVIPECPVIPSKADNGDYMYTFTGWREQIMPVSTNEAENVYNASFQIGFIVPLSGGKGAKLSIDDVNDRYVVDCTAVRDTAFNLEYLLPRALKTGGVELKAKSFTLMLSYSELVAMSEEGITAVSVSSVKNESDSYSFSVDFYDPDGNSASTALGATLSLQYSFSDPDDMRLYYEKEGVRQYHSAVISGGRLVTRVSAGVSYHAVVEYALNVIASDIAPLTVEKTVLKRGDNVEISYTVPIGYEVVGLYIIKENGEREILSGSSFTMPGENVSVGIDVKRSVYTVVFMTEGKVLSSKTYYYGELPVAPVVPKKANDEVFSYEFSEWDKQITEVTENAVYNAIYVSTPLPPADISDPVFVERLWTLITKVIVVAAYGCAICVPLFVIIVVKIVRRSNIKAKKD